MHKKKPGRQSEKLNLTGNQITAKQTPATETDFIMWGYKAEKLSQER